MLKIAFVFIAEAYQAYHGAAVLFELAARPDVEVDVFHIDPATPEHLEKLAKAHGVPPIVSQRLPAGVLGGAIQSVRLLGLAKPQVMARNEQMLRGYDAVVSTEDGIVHLFEGEPEGERPARILITHGPAQRKVPSHARRVECDLILVKGPADVAAYLRDGIGREGHIASAGYPKFVTTRLLARDGDSLFPDDNPIVLYNPHKDRKAGSWKRFFEPMMRAFETDHSRNLVVAPHIKMFRRRPARVRAALAARSRANIVIDPDSDRLLDNSYTEAADIYVGDVSSQVFEFVARPRPCVFLNAAGAQWQENPHFYAWQMGEVVDDPAELMPAIARAPRVHEDYREKQRELAELALGDTSAQSVERSAGLILQYLRDGRVDP